MRKRNLITAIAGSPLVVVFIAWACSVIFPQTREWWLSVLVATGKGIACAWHWLWADVATPRAVFWLLLIALLVASGLLIAGVRRYRAKIAQLSAQRTSAPPPQVQQPALPALDETDLRVLHTFVALRSHETMPLNFIADHLLLNEHRALVALARLQRHNYVMSAGTTDADIRLFELMDAEFPLIGPTRFPRMGTT